ncbi:hypothetical protein K0B90_03170 [bacterium]|nr:hypothetical protein [bacterium]
MKKEIPLPDDWTAPIIEGINAMIPDELKAPAITFVRHPAAAPAFRLLADRGYDDAVLWEVIRTCAYWSHFPERANGHFSNRALMQNAQQAARGLYKILRSELDGTRSSIASAVCRTLPSAPELDDKTIMLALLMLEEYFAVFSSPGRKQLDLRVPGLLRGLRRLLLDGKRKTIQTDGAYEAIALLRQACLGGKKVTATSIKKEIERFRRRFPEATGNK